MVTVRIGNQRWLDRGGAVAYYLDALQIYDDLVLPAAATAAMARYRAQFLEFFLNGRKMKFDSVAKNLVCCGRLLRFYRDDPVAWLKITCKILLLKRRPFFLGWEKLGNPS